MGCDKAAGASTSRMLPRQFEYITLILYDWICRFKVDFCSVSGIAVPLFVI